MSGDRKALLQLKPLGGIVTSRLSVIQVVSPPRLSNGDALGITGPERRALNVARHWGDLNIDPIILYPRRGALWSDFIASGLPVIDFEPTGKWDVGAIARLASLARSTRANIIHSQGGPALDLMVVVAAKLVGAQSVITRPVMIEDHKDRPSITTSLFNHIDRSITLRFAAATVAVSQDGFDRLRLGAPIDKLHLIKNGIKPYPSERLVAARSRDPSATAQVGMIGHLLPYKGWLDFLEVAARFKDGGPRVCWHIVGEGPQRAALEKRAEMLGLGDQVVFHGLLTDVSQALFSWDLFLFTSHREGLSVAVLEAMNAGLPIVATDVAGIHDQVIEGVNGSILPVGDIEGLTNTVKAILSDKENLRHMGNNSRTRLEDNFSEQKMLENYASLYHNVVNGVVN